MDVAPYVTGAAATVEIAGAAATMEVAGAAETEKPADDPENADVTGHPALLMNPMLQSPAGQRSKEYKRHKG